jgi:hypothetical protein
MIRLIAGEPACTLWGRGDGDIHVGSDRRIHADVDSSTLARGISWRALMHTDTGLFVTLLGLSHFIISDGRDLPFGW